VDEAKGRCVINIVLATQFIHRKLLNCVFFIIFSVYHQVISLFTVLVEYVAWYCGVATMNAVLNAVPHISSALLVFDMLIVGR
jgi:hypothetical protein